MNKKKLQNVNNQAILCILILTYIILVSITINTYSRVCWTNEHTHLLYPNEKFISNYTPARTKKVPKQKCIDRFKNMSKLSHSPLEFTLFLLIINHSKVNNISDVRKAYCQRANNKNWHLLPVKNFNISSYCFFTFFFFFSNLLLIYFLNESQLDKP